MHPVSAPLLRRLLIALLGCAAASVALAEDAIGVAAAPILAPTGTLRVGVYPGSPTSLVRTRAGEERGVSVELGRELARRLGVPVVLVERPRVAEVVDDVAAGRVDLTVTNASPARAERIAFTGPLLALELGFLVPAGSDVRSEAELDDPARRIGVTQGSTSERMLPRRLPKAAFAPVPSMAQAVELLRSGGLDAFATNKSVLFELSDALPGSRILAGRWGLEHLALAYPKGREPAAPYLAAFVADLQASGFLADAAGRAGLRGQASTEP